LGLSLSLDTKNFLSLLFIFGRRAIKIPLVENQIVLKDIAKIYHQGAPNEVRALHDVSFEIKKGEFVVILGASGAGKSTLLNILGGMDKATSGLYLLDGSEVSSYKEKELSSFRRTEVGFVFQFYNLMPNLTALENVELAASLGKNPFDSSEILRKVGLEKRWKNFPSELSGGEQQRVSIARAIVKNPTILLCDEPTGALDSKTGASIVSLLKEVAREYDKTVIVVTHNSLLGEIADRLIRIRDGSLESVTLNPSPKRPEDLAW